MSIALIFIVIAVYVYSRYQYSISTPVNPTNDEKIGFIIKKDDTAGIIAANLYQKNFILDTESFKWYAKLNKLDQKIKNGRFLLSQDLTVPQILETITSREQSQVVLTIPEGTTVEEIDQKLAELELIFPGSFNDAVKQFNQYRKYPFITQAKVEELTYPLEGYLFPDTYFLNPNEFSNEILISMMLNNFKKKIDSLNLQGSKRNFDEIINVAAMIEKEANRDKDRPLIADIIWRRLEQNWQLGIDATSLYLEKDRILDYKDLQKDSDYNTRLKRGLPPGPICNPGLKSIEAAAFPENNDYMYYLTSKEGEMIYSKTLVEHNRNKAKYL